MGNGEWGMGNGEWGMGNGEWGMGNGEWGMSNVNLPLVSLPPAPCLFPVPIPHSLNHLRRFCTTAKTIPNVAKIAAAIAHKGKDGD